MILLKNEFSIIEYTNTRFYKFNSFAFMYAQLITQTETSITHYSLCDIHVKNKS